MMMKGSCSGVGPLPAAAAACTASTGASLLRTTRLASDRCCDSSSYACKDDVVGAGPLNRWKCLQHATWLTPDEHSQQGMLASEYQRYRTGCV